VIVGWSVSKKRRFVNPDGFLSVWCPGKGVWEMAR
jgi:hypothetical protein